MRSKSVYGKSILVSRGIKPNQESLLLNLYLKVAFLLIISCVWWTLLLHLFAVIWHLKITSHFADVDLFPSSTCVQWLVKDKHRNGLLNSIIQFSASSPWLAKNTIQHHFMVQDQGFAPAFNICCLGWLSTTLSSCKSVLVTMWFKSCPVRMQVINIPVTQFKAGTPSSTTYPIVCYDNSYPRHTETGWGSNSNSGYRRGALPSVSTVLVLGWFTPCHQELQEWFTQQGCADHSTSLVTTACFLITIG